MATEQDTTPRRVSREPVDRHPTSAGRRLSGNVAELAAYSGICVAIALFLWWRVRAVDSYYLDEWIYVHGAQVMWDNLPGGFVEAIPSWDRGPQRLYPLLLAPIWGPLGASTAYTLSHVLNVLLLSSAVVPTALFARRVIAARALRVFAVALGVAVPWLMIGAHLLAENLAFPVFLWTLYAIVRAAEAPSLWRQALALAAILAGTLCRLNLAAMLAVFVVAVVAAEALDRRERRHEPLGRWLRQALRREALVVAATVLGAVTALLVLGSSSSSLGRYGVVDLDVLRTRLVGDQSQEARRLLATYGRSLVVGTLILPFVLGVAVGLAGTLGRLGRRMVIPSAAALSALVVMLVAVSVYTFVVPEERYVFVVITPIAVLGVAALEHLDRLQRWVAAAAAVTLWLLITGLPMPAMDAQSFFGAPAGGFWTRVVEHRLRALESDVLGWTLLAPTGWLVLALALGALLVWLSRSRRWSRVRVGVLAGALGVCLAGQLGVLAYSFKQELYGTSSAPGGVALSDDRDVDRERWIDAALPDDVSAAVVPGMVTTGTPAGYAEALTFWSKDLSGTVSLSWIGAPAPTPSGFSLVDTTIDPAGLAAWQGSPPGWLVAQRDDPRVQFAGRVAGRSEQLPFEALELTGSPRAVWTAQGLGADARLASGTKGSLVLDRAQAPDVRQVDMTLHPVDPATPARWRILRDGRELSAGRIDGKDATRIRLAVPRCPSAGSCPPATWQMTVRAPAGADPARPLAVQFDAVRLTR